MSITTLLYRRSDPLSSSGSFHIYGQAIPRLEKSRRDPERIDQLPQPEDHFRRSRVEGAHLREQDHTIRIAKHRLEIVQDREPLNSYCHKREEVSKYAETDTTKRKLVFSRVSGFICSLVTLTFLRSRAYITQGRFGGTSPFCLPLST